TITLHYRWIGELGLAFEALRPRDRTVNSNPFLSAITPYANSLSGSGRALKGPVVARFSAIAPDFPWSPGGSIALSPAVSLQSSGVDVYGPRPIATDWLDQDH